MEFEKELAAKIARTDEIVQKFLPAESGAQKKIMEAVNYSVTAGGKRLRPLLLSEMSILFGGTEYAEQKQHYDCSRYHVAQARKPAVSIDKHKKILLFQQGGA